MAAKIDIAQSIREVLNDDHPVTIYGLGTFQLIHLPAGFGELRRTLLPPRIDLQLEDRTTDNRALIDVLRRDHGLSDKEASGLIERYSGAIINALINYKKVNIPGVALISKDKQGEFSIQPDKDFLEAYYGRLPELAVKLQPKKQIPTLTALQSPAVETGKKPGPAETPPSDKAKSMIPDEGYLPPVEDSPDKALPPDEEKKGSSWIAWLLPVIGSAIIILATIILFKACFSQEKSTEPVVDRQDEVVQSLFEEDNEQAHQQEAVMPEECIIITGSFASAANVTKMQDLVASKGYQSYTEDFGPYTRVGLIFDCAGRSLEDFLRQIRNEISPRAWYLEPELYVEY